MWRWHELSVTHSEPLFHIDRIAPKKDLLDISNGLNFLSLEYNVVKAFKIIYE